MVSGRHPIGEPHFKDSKIGAFNGIVQRLARSRIAAVHKRCPVWVLKSVAVRLNRVVMMDLEAFPTPPIIQRPFVVHDPIHMLNHAVKRTGEGELAQMRQPFFDKGCSHDRERFFPFPVGDVLPFEEKKGEAEDVVSVNVSDEHRAQVGDVYSSAAKPGESGWRGVDDVAPINHGKGVVTPMGQKRIPRSQHVNAWGHAQGKVCAFLFPSVVPV